MYTLSNFYINLQPTRTGSSFLYIFFREARKLHRFVKNFNANFFFFFTSLQIHGASQVALVVKNPPVNAGDVRDAGSIPGLGRSHGEGNGNPFQYSCLENPMNGGAWQPTVHSQTYLIEYYTALCKSKLQLSLCIQFLRFFF